MGFRVIFPVGQHPGGRVDGASMLCCSLLPGGVRDLSEPGGSGFCLVTVAVLVHFTAQYAHWGVDRYHAV